MNPRSILERLVARLEPEVGKVSPSDLSFWEREEKTFTQAMANGRAHKIEALLLAQEALASGDEEKITEAALLCPTFERTGNDWDRARGAKTIQSARGGHERVHGTKEAKEARWSEMYSDYLDALAKGRTKSRAQELVGLKHGVSSRTIRTVAKKYEEKS